MDKLCSAISFPLFWKCSEDSICFDAFPPQFCGTEGVAGLCCLEPDAAVRETDFQFELQVTESVCENVDTVRQEQDFPGCILHLFLQVSFVHGAVFQCLIFLMLL